MVQANGVKVGGDMNKLPMFGAALLSLSIVVAQ